MRTSFGRAVAAILAIASWSVSADLRAEPASAWAPWLALEGARPSDTVQLERTERLLGLGRAFTLNRRLHPDVARLVEEMEKRITVLDAGSFYELLGRGARSEQTRRWFELEGRLAGTHYPLKAWRRAPRPDEFGELKAHFGLRPAETRGGYVLTTELAGDLGDLRFEHVAAFVREVLSWMETTREDPGGELQRAFPRTKALADRYAAIGAEVSPGEAGTKVRIRIALNEEKIGDGFPQLGAMLDRLRGLADADIAVVRGPAQLARAVIDSKELVTTVEFTVREAKIVPVVDGRPAGAPIDLTTLETLEYEVRSHLHSNMSGLEITVKDLIVATRFRREPVRAGWRGVLNRTPSVRAEGSFGIIPLWMVDAFIPSDVETLATDFFRVMAKGNDGAGLTTQVDMPVGPGSGRYAARAEGELLSNGFLTFCLRAVMSSMGDREALRRDLSKLYQAFLDAFEADLEGALEK